MNAARPVARAFSDSCSSRPASSIFAGVDHDLGGRACFAPRWISWFTLFGSPLLVLTLPWPAILVAVVIAICATSTRHWLQRRQHASA
jgi:hypothetical protein